MSGSLKLVLLCTTLSLLLGACQETPSDEKMIDIFQNQRRTFEELRHMLEEDTTLKFVNESSVIPDSVVTADRVEQYRRLMDKAGISSARAVPGSEKQKRTLFFTAYALGLSISGRSKGYSYAPIQPDSTVNNLTRFEARIDSLREEGQKILAPFMYRKIEGSWYLYFTTD